MPKLADMRTQTNFGGNQTWQSRCYRPASDQAVLDILERHRDGHLRPVGGKHSWSDCAASSDVSLDMALFNEVQPYQVGGENRVRVGAGCTLQAVLDRLHAQSDQTLPTLGVIKKQTIAGAISTGTHGSGKPSLSHFVVSVRVAAYDRAGQPRIFDYRDGDELKAGRCGLGCTGVILSVDLRTVPKYHVQETVVLHGKLEIVLSRYDEYPLTQFSLIPYRWDYLVFERKELARRTLSPAEKFNALCFRLYNAVWVDRVIHWTVKLGVMAGNGFVKYILLKPAPYFFWMRGPRLDDAEQVLTMGHDLVQHEEMELFVPASRLRELVELLRCITEVFAGEEKPVPAQIRMKLDGLGLYDELLQNRGTYTQHYPYFFRRVLPDDTLISMTSSAEEAYYSVSVFTYFPPHKREGYYAFCSWLARCMSRLVDARLHWGKHFPLGAADIARRYPRLETFKQLCADTDPKGVFRNAYAERVLGLPMAPIG